MLERLLSCSASVCSSLDKPMYAPADSQCPGEGRRLLPARPSKLTAWLLVQPQDWRPQGPRRPTMRLQLGLALLRLPVRPRKLTA